jgi:type I restriction enzyme M protein
MANSASDAGHSEKEIRRKLIESRAVDVVVAVGPNMFYTVTPPCTLWFLDRGKWGTPREDRVLFLDARHIYRQVDRAHRDWTEGPIGFLANVVRLYRGEEPDYTLGGDEARVKIDGVFGKRARYVDVAGLCRGAPVTELEAQAWSLNPGRYVGAVAGEEIGDQEFAERFTELSEEFEALNTRADELRQVISSHVVEILGS